MDLFAGCISMYMYICIYICIYIYIYIYIYILDSKRIRKHMDLVAHNIALANPIKLRLLVALIFDCHNALACL